MFIERAAIELVAVDLEQVNVARRAFSRFGKWGVTPAGLNYGDCFAYALATVRGEPLLYKGEDFSQTDVRLGSPWPPEPGAVTDRDTAT